MTKNLKVQEQIIRARAGLILEQPFIGALALRLPLFETDTIPTLAVDGRQILYNPSFVEGLTPALTKSAIGHEVLHCVFDHVGRTNGRNPRKYNQAADFVINQMLKDSGFEIGKGWLQDDKYIGMTSDQIYNMLPDTEPGDNDPLDDITGTPSAPLTGDEVHQWKMATVQSANAARMMGKLPASMDRFVTDLTSSKIDWKTVLRRFILHRNDADYSWSRPNRRMLSNEIYLPSLYSECMGEIVVAVDTSGSIDAETLRVFGSELKGIIEDARPSKVHVVYCDSHINKYVSFGPEDDFKLEAVGGGGTAFSPVRDFVIEQGINPVCLVYLTDLYGPTNFQAPEYPWMWCTIGSIDAAFGEVIEVKE